MRRKNCIYDFNEHMERCGWNFNPCLWYIIPRPYHESECWGTLWTSLCGRIFPSQHLYFTALLSVTPGNTQGIGYSFFPISLISDTLFLIRGRFSTGSRLCLADQLGALCSWWEWSITETWPSSGLPSLSPPLLWTLPDQPKYDSVHSVPGSLDPPRVPTHSPYISYKVTWLSAWFSAASFRTGTHKWCWLYKRIWLKEKALHYHFELVHFFHFTKRIT